MPGRIDGVRKFCGKSHGVLFGCDSLICLASQELYTVRYLHHSVSPIHTAIKRKKKRSVRCNPLCSTTAFSGHSPFVVCDCGMLRTVADFCGPVRTFAESDPPRGSQRGYLRQNR